MKHLFIFITLVIFFGCQNKKQHSYSTKKVVSEITIHPGKKLLQSKCNVCHSPSTSQKDRIAPPMIAVKKHYISDGITKEEFVLSIQNWITNPVQKNVKMRGAVRKFGVMPKQEFSKEDIQLIADYMFTNEIEKPVWFDEHCNNQKKGKKI